MNRIERAARLLRQSSSLVVMVGPSWLAYADPVRLLKAVDCLVKQPGARLVVLPEQGNLIGSLLLGIPRDKTTAGDQEPEVLYLVGENLPVSLPGHPFVLYQNIYPPSPGCQADLLLPAAAFSEEEGTLINHAGRLQEVHRSVPPPGEALPTWEILCRIAQKMGVQGFAYASAAAIRAEIAGLIPGFQPGSCVDLSPLLRAGRSARRHKTPASASGAGGDSLFTRQTCPHTYLGFPLAQWVAGLRQIYPDESRQDHV